MFIDRTHQFRTVINKILLQAQFISNMFSDISNFAIRVYCITEIADVVRHLAKLKKRQKCAFIFQPHQPPKDIFCRTLVKMRMQKLRWQQVWRGCSSENTSCSAELSPARIAAIFAMRKCVFVFMNCLPMIVMISVICTYYILKIVNNSRYNFVHIFKSSLFAQKSSAIYRTITSIFHIL